LGIRIATRILSTFVHTSSMGVTRKGCVWVYPGYQKELLFT
jgi:hypothetical protein